MIWKTEFYSKETGNRRQETVNGVLLPQSLDLIWKTDSVVRKQETGF